MPSSSSKAEIFTQLLDKLPPNNRAEAQHLAETYGLGVGTNYCNVILSEGYWQKCPDKMIARSKEERAPGQPRPKRKSRSRKTYSF